MATMDATRAVRAATQAHLPSPDLGLNFEACDAVRDASDADVIEALREIAARLNPVRGQNAPRQPTLALSLLENCVDNCGPRFIELAKDERNSPLIARLDELHSQNIGAGIPGIILRKLGLEIATGAGGSGMRGDAIVMSRNNNERQEDAVNVLSKLRSEMNVVEERIKSDRGTSTDEIHDRNEFFEQCLPRLEKLIEFGASGGLPDDIVEKCLLLHDAALEALKADDALVDLSDNIGSIKTDGAGAASNETGSGATDRISGGAGADWVSGNTDGAGASIVGSDAGAFDTTNSINIGAKQQQQPMLMPTPLVPASNYIPAQTEISSPAGTPVNMYSPVSSPIPVQTSVSSLLGTQVNMHSSAAKAPPPDHTIDTFGSDMAISSPQQPLMDSGYGIQPSSASGFTHVQPPSIGSPDVNGGVAQEESNSGENGASMAKTSASTKPEELFSSFDPFAPSKQ